MVNDQRSVIKRSVFQWRYNRVIFMKASFGLLVRQGRNIWRKDSIFENDCIIILPFKYIVLPDIKSKLRVAQQLKWRKAAEWSCLSFPQMITLCFWTNAEMNSIQLLATWMEKKDQGMQKMVFPIGSIAFAFLKNCATNRQMKNRIIKAPNIQPSNGPTLLPRTTILAAMTILKNETIP